MNGAKTDVMPRLEIGVVVRDKEGNVKSEEVQKVPVIEAFLGKEAYSVYKQCINTEANKNGNVY